MFEVTIKKDGKVIATAQGHTFKISHERGAEETEPSGLYRNYIHNGEITTTIKVITDLGKSIRNSAGDVIPIPPSVPEPARISKQDAELLEAATMDYAELGKSFRIALSNGMLSLNNVRELDGLPPVAAKPCPDCRGTRQYQPLIGPAEPCKTCCGGQA